MKILPIEDDVKVAGLLQRGLGGAGHAVDAEYDGEAGEQAALLRKTGWPCCANCARGAGR
jgi:DNA-binding response OmpR family regulator